MNGENIQRGFYRAFEERFRGSQDLIRSRLEQYGPFLDAIVATGTHRPALDLGCGRGEWLELLRDRGIKASGVDLDEEMLAAARERQLDVREGDAIDALCHTADGSLSIVTGFHIAEHVPFERLQTLISEAYRALEPGGLLLLETPNPENIRVASHTFYLDPSHEKPLPPALLSFLIEHAGFKRKKILRLQEASAIRSASPTVAQVLFGASPDYSVLAQRSGEAEFESKFDTAFAIDFGISEDELTRRYDEDQENWKALLRDEIASLNEGQIRHETAFAKIERLVSKVENLATELSSIRNRHVELLEAIGAEKEARLSEQATLAAMYSSTSWKLTAPLRSIVCWSRWLRDDSVAWITLRPDSRQHHILSKLTGPLLIRIRKELGIRPQLKGHVLRLLGRWPR